MEEFHWYPINPLCSPGKDFKWGEVFRLTWDIEGSERVGLIQWIINKNISKHLNFRGVDDVRKLFVNWKVLYMHWPAPSWMGKNVVRPPNLPIQFEKMIYFMLKKDTKKPNWCELVEKMDFSG